jgi:hypothetical protein
MDDLKVPLANLMAKNNVVAQLYPHQKRLLVMMGEINQTEGNGITDLTRRISGHYGPAGFSRPAESARIGCRSESNSSGHRLASRSCCRSRTASFRGRSMLSLRRNIALLTLDLMARRARIYICGISGLRRHSPSGGSRGVSRIFRSSENCLLSPLPRNNDAVMTRIDCPRSGHARRASISFSALTSKIRRTTGAYVICH